MTDGHGTPISCVIHGVYLDPGTCMKIINHELRKKILQRLHLLTIRGPISKKMLADDVGVGYYELIYQLNNHLKDFWQVSYEEKKRGAREEFIAPPEANAIYIMLSSGATIYLLDPLANLYGNLAVTGTRCEQCSQTQINRCMEEIGKQPCFKFCDEEKQRLTKLLEMNNRREKFTPVDLIIACTALRSLEGQSCVVNLARTSCTFLRRIEAHI